MAWGHCGAPTYRALRALLSPAVLADDVLLVTDDRGADPGHVQWTPTGPLSEQPWSPKAGHHQRDGGSWAARTVPAGAAGRAGLPDTHPAVLPRVCVVLALGSALFSRSFPTTLPEKSMRSSLPWGLPCKSLFQFLLYHSSKYHTFPLIL